MKNGWTRAAVMLGVAGLLAAAPLNAISASAAGKNTARPATAATQPKQIGVITQNTYGIPHASRLGHTITARTWYRQNSKDTLVPIMFGLQIWNTATAHTTGVSVSWLNPLTGKWQRARHPDVNDFVLDISTSMKQIHVAPDVWAHIDFRITFGTNAKTGTWHIRPAVPNAYQLLNPKGVPQMDYLGGDTGYFAVRVTR